MVRELEFSRVMDDITAEQLICLWPIHGWAKSTGKDVIDVLRQHVASSVNHPAPPVCVCDLSSWAVRTPAAVAARWSGKTARRQHQAWVRTPLLQLGDRIPVQPHGQPGSPEFATLR